MSDPLPSYEVEMPDDDDVPEACGEEIDRLRQVIPPIGARPADTHDYRLLYHAGLMSNDDLCGQLVRLRELCRTLYAPVMGDLDDDNCNNGWVRVRRAAVAAVVKECEQGAK